MHTHTHTHMLNYCLFISNLTSDSIYSSAACFLHWLWHLSVVCGGCGSYCCPHLIEEEPWGSQSQVTGVSPSLAGLGLQLVLCDSRTWLPEAASQPPPSGDRVEELTVHMTSTGKVDLSQPLSRLNLKTFIWSSNTNLTLSLLILPRIHSRRA